jgi:hypothetical protein
MSCSDQSEEGGAAVLPIVNCAACLEVNEETGGAKYAKDARCAVFLQKCTLEDAIGSHACSLEALAYMRPMAFLSDVHLLPVDTVNSVQTRKDVVCYSPGAASMDTFFVQKETAIIEQNEPHLPHDCGVQVSMKFLCQQCPSGCGASSFSFVDEFIFR